MEVEKYPYVRLAKVERIQMKCALEVEEIVIGTGIGQGVVAEAGAHEEDADPDPGPGPAPDLGLGLEEVVVVIDPGLDLPTNLHLDVTKINHLQAMATMLVMTLLITNSKKK